MEKITRRFLSGKGTHKSEDVIRKRERIAGGVLTGTVLIVSTLIPALLLYLLYRFSWKLGLLAETFFCYQMLAARSLEKESDKVYRALREDGLAAGRQAVSMIVGRDTGQLEEEGVVKAAVETVAENTSDGIVAPMFYMMLGGAVGGFAYKAVNTMDSMIGYQNEKYRYFGTAAARLDDVLNFLPARISAWLMILSAGLAGRLSGLNKKEDGAWKGYDGKGARRIYLRDRRNHKSPNSAQTEAVMAGALGVQLAGDAYYFGKRYEKPTIGDDIRRIEVQDIRRSHRLMYLTAWSALVLFCAVKILIVLILI